LGLRCEIPDPLKHFELRPAEDDEMSEQSPPATALPDWAQPGARYTMSMEPAIAMRTAKFDWDYEIQVALPASYEARPDKRYPVLWLTDGPLLIHLAVGVANALVFGGLAPEMIIVGVGCASQAGVAEYGRRRTIDLAPPGKSLLFDGPGGDFMRKLGLPTGAQLGEDLLAFLVDELRPALAKKYRMEDDHGLMGHSGGGMFASYALFARPGAFSRFIIGSPSSNAADRAAFKLEAAYAAANKDLKANVFFGAGEQEIGQLMMAAWGIVSAPVLMAETLLLRQYPALKVTTRIFAAKDHFTVLPDILLEGIRAVWADRVDLSKRPFA
jgi:predicted alpha/beta superfamily hydrolase